LRLSTITLRRAALVACVVAGAVPATSAAATSRTALPDSAPNWATPSAQVGSAPNTQTKTFWVYLKLRNSGELDQRIAAVSDPAGASYGNYLTPAQFDARYAPSKSAVSAVSNWLRSAGFSVSSDDAPSNNRWVEATGDVAQVEKAFSTQIRTYRHAGRVLQAPNGDLSIPRSVSKSITGITGLDGSDRLVKPLQTAQPTPGDLTSAPPSPAFVNAPPCSTYWGEHPASDQPPAYGQTQPYAPCGYTPSQLEGAYGIGGAIGSGNNGSGQTVAIIDAFASPTILQDANQYSSLHGLPPVGFRQIVPPGVFNAPADDPCDPQGWYGEETLDVEAVHSMAPGANVLYVGGKDCNDESLISAMNKIVDKRQAQIITNSYGDAGEDVPRGIVRAWNDTFRQAAVEGIGVYFSSGDEGDEIADIGTRSTDFPASDPLVTAVGGTSLGVGQSNDYLFETGWGTSTSTLTNGDWAPTPPGDYLYGGGGGTSQVFAEPGYQKGVVPGRIARYFGGRPGRAVPDVSAVGDPQTGMLVGQTQTFPDGTTKYSEYRLGGTSLSSPLFAGIMALADQAGGTHHGFANPLFYSDAGSSVFHDIVDPNTQLAVVRNDYVNGVDATDGTTTKLRSFNTTGTIHTRPGYDDVTGVGTPDGQAFIDGIANPGKAQGK
jgi:subtilase family serine protease